MASCVHTVLARALCVAVLLHTALIPSRAEADKSPYWIVPGGGIGWLPNEYPVKSSRPGIGGEIGAGPPEAWAAAAHVGYLQSLARAAGAPPRSFLRVEGNVTPVTAVHRGST